MALHRLLADCKFAGDFAITVSFFDGRDNFNFPRGEAEAAAGRLAGACPGADRFASNPKLTFADRTNTLEQQLRRRRLQHNPTRSQLQRGGHGKRLNGGGEQDGAQRQFLAREFAKHFHSRHARHREIQQKNVGLQFGGQRNGVLSVRSFGNHLKVLLGGKQASQAVTKNRMIIGDENSNWVWFHSFYAMLARAKSGTLISRRAPCPGFETMVSSPPMARTRCLTTNGPRRDSSSST